ncbi:MAG: type II toxin-antitoxin system HicB family antitoxin [Pseudonocardiaceae bacterium]
MRYAIVIEPTAHGWSAYVPDLPGCIAAARYKAKVRLLIAKGMALHLEGLREDGEPVPLPSSVVGYVEVGA